MFSRSLLAGCLSLILASAKLSAAVGDLLATSYTTGDIFQYTPAGSGTTFAAAAVTGAQGVAYDNAGNLFVSDNSGSIYKFTAAGTQSLFYSSGGSYAFRGLAFDSSGNLFAAGSDGSINEITPGGALSSFGSVPSIATGLAFDHAGNLFVAGVSSGSIYEFTSLGVMSTFASGLTTPQGLAIDASNNVFVGVGTGIMKFTAANVSNTFATVSNGVSGLAFDENGYLFAADSNYGGGHIYKYSPTAIRTTFAAGLITPSYLVFETAAIPEPASWAMLCSIGTLAFVALRRKSLR